MILLVSARYREGPPDRSSSPAPHCSLSFMLQCGFFIVEPRGFEPPTSAVQRRRDSLLGLSGACKIAANKRISTLSPLLLFQEIYSGCCTVAAHTECSQHFIYYIKGRGRHDGWASFDLKQARTLLEGALTLTTSSGHYFSRRNAIQASVVPSVVRT